MTIFDTYTLTCLLLSISGAVKSLEMAALKYELAPRGIFDWNIIGPTWMRRSPAVGLLARIYSPQGMMGIGLTCTLCGFLSVLFILTDVAPVYGKILGTVIFACMFLLYYRQDLGTDGADQMSFFVSIAVLVCFCLSSSEFINLVGIIFIAGQLCISYFASGFSKLFSSSWRQGLAAKGVLSTHTYGNKFTQDFFKRYAGASLLICWATIGWEILFPFIFFFDGGIFFLGIFVGIVFHLSVGLFMGLNAFVWAFGAAYPSVIYIGTQLL